MLRRLAPVERAQYLALRGRSIHLATPFRRARGRRSVVNRGSGPTPGARRRQSARQPPGASLRAPRPGAGGALRTGRGSARRTRQPPRARARRAGTARHAGRADSPGRPDARGGRQPVELPGRRREHWPGCARRDTGGAACSPSPPPPSWPRACGGRTTARPPAPRSCTSPARRMVATASVGKARRIAMRSASDATRREWPAE